MERHCKYISSLCRICSKKLSPTRKPKELSSYSKIVKVVYSIECAQEDALVFPKSICDSCRRFLDRLADVEEKDLPKKEPHLFEPHMDVVCRCVSSVGRPLKRPSSDGNNLSMSLFKTKVVDCGMYVTEVKPDSIQLLRTVLVVGKILPLEIFVNIDGSWKISIANRKLDKENCTVLANVPGTITNDNSLKFLQSILQIQVCPGNDDFCDIVKSKVDFFSRNGDIVSPDGIVRNRIETPHFLPLSSDSYTTIRSTSCQVLVSSGRCSPCLSYRNTLFAMRSNKRSSAKISEKTNDRYLDREELLEKVASLEKEKRALVAKTVRLQKRIAKEIEKKGVAVPEETNTILSEVICSESPFPVDSPQYLLWEQQKKQAALKDSRQMRWHPLIIRWCLSIYLKSPGTYKAIQASPFMALPSKKTLLKYINFTDPGCGFNNDILKRLATKVGLPNIPDHEKNVGVCFDEMKIKSGLVFCKSTGKMVGFTDLGDINEELDEFRRRCLEEGQQDRELATYMIVFMVRSLSGGVNYSFGHFATDGFSSYELFPCVWEAVRVLESIGLSVLSLTSDGASPNRKFFRLHRSVLGDNGDVIHWTWNRYARSRKIYFFSDVPHLVKTTRNNLENSHGNCNTRNLMVDGQILGWHQITSAYEWDLGLQRGAVGLRYLHKLGDDHIKLSPRSRMRVNLAAQVLSTSMVKCLEQQGHHSTLELRKFISLVDIFFDCLNVSSLLKGDRTRKEALQPYRSVTDWRFTWLTDTFLAYLNSWEAAAMAVPGLTPEEKNRLCLSKQTLEGYRVTVKSFVELGRWLLTDGSAEYVLSEKFTQDPLEEEFAKQRLKGGCNDNPTAEEFNRNALGINVAGDGLIRTAGNTHSRHGQQLDVHDMRMLPKKRR